MTVIHSTATFANTFYLVCLNFFILNSLLLLLLWFLLAVIFLFLLPLSLSLFPTLSWSLCATVPFKALDTPPYQVKRFASGHNKSINNSSNNNCASTIWMQRARRKQTKKNSYLSIFHYKLLLLSHFIFLFSCRSRILYCFHILCARYIYLVRKRVEMLL